MTDGGKQRSTQGWYAGTPAASGILTVRVPKTEQGKAHRIEITG